jgi:membrane associated rhomboid family serine protease
LSTRPAVTFGPGTIVGLVAAGVLAFCGSLKWIDGDPGITGYNVPAKFLVDVKVQQEGVSIGALLLLIAVVGAVGALVPSTRFLMIVAGAAALVVVVLHAYQLGEFADLVNEDPFTGEDVGRSDLVGIGVWVAVAAAIGLVVGGVLSRRTDRRAVPS